MDSEPGTTRRCGGPSCEQIGVAALPIPEEHDGAGARSETAVVLEELGRSLAPSPLLARWSPPRPLLACTAPTSNGPSCCPGSRPARSPPSCLEPPARPASPAPTIVLACRDDDLLEVDRRRDPSAAGARPDPAARPPRRRDGSTPARSRCSRRAAVARRRPRSRSGIAQRGLDMTRRLHQGAGPVRPADRLLPGAQAPDGRHAGPGRDVALGVVGGLRRTAYVADPTGRAEAAPRATVARPTAPSRSSRSPPRRSSCTAASRSPGSTTPTWSSSAPTRSASCSGLPGTIARPSSSRTPAPGNSFTQAPHGGRVGLLQTLTPGVAHASSARFRPRPHCCRRVGRRHAVRHHRVVRGTGGPANDRLEVYVGEIPAAQLADIVALGVDRHELEVSQVRAARTRREGAGRGRGDPERRPGDRLERQGVEMEPKRIDGQTVAARATAAGGGGLRSSARTPAPAGSRRSTADGRSPTRGSPSWSRSARPCRARTSSP